ncbi:hypothetical protein EX30DRAFT_125601 [Ascodesmis nigricans]|uniref:Uncharacterized protein n=1 Tax=Ascodesmis nigricans TaxID=341454 RepID=A0A4S2MPH4_9PEZI|nr:hypothetical protein EX30DRAFT_125601 [Ascodesmis nigricans]
MSSPPRNVNPERRGSTLSDYFTAKRVPDSYPGSISNAAAQANQRRMSVSGNSPPQLSNYGLRRSSVSSVSSTSSTAEEPAVDEPSDAQFTEPTSPLARRMSWGARAFKDFKLPVTPMNTSPMGKTPGAGPQSPIISRGFWMDTKSTGVSDPAHQRRRMSMSSMPAPATSMPAAKEPPAQKPDHLQERILKGDFYMD